MNGITNASDIIKKDKKRLMYLEWLKANRLASSSCQDGSFLAKGAGSPQHNDVFQLARNRHLDKHARIEITFNTCYEARNILAFECSILEVLANFAGAGHTTARPNDIQQLSH